MNVIERAKQLANGAAILAEWAIDGIVVDNDTSQKRADICTGRLNGDPCPMNVDGWKFTEEAAAAAKRIVELQKGLSLKVFGLKSLRTCAGCGCPLKTKIFLPIDQIRPEPEEFNKYDPRCWLTKEI